MASIESKSGQNQLVKVLVVGGPEVGKSALIGNFNGEPFSSAYTPTLTTDIKVKDIKVVSNDITAHIWDIGASKVMGRAFFRATHAVVFVVDMTSRSSLDGLQGLYERIRALALFADDSFPCILLGNKSDAGRRLELNKAHLTAWTKTVRREPIPCFEVSAKNGNNVTKAFETIFQLAIENPAKIGPYYKDTESSILTGSATPSSDALASNLALLQSSRVSLEVDEPSFDEDEDDGALDNDAPPEAKVIMAGAMNVGKTCILTRFTGARDEEVPSRYEPTIGTDFRIKEVSVGPEVNITLQIWDHSGDPKTQILGKTFYKNSNGLILVFDITNLKSFQALDLYWDNYVKYSYPDEIEDPDYAEHFPVVLVGNKSDINERRAVDMEDILNWCTEKRPRTPVTYLGPRSASSASPRCTASLHFLYAPPRCTSRCLPLTLLRSTMHLLLGSPPWITSLMPDLDVLHVHGVFVPLSVPCSPFTSPLHCLPPVIVCREFVFSPPECSALHNISINDVFIQIAEDIYREGFNLVDDYDEEEDEEVHNEAEDDETDGEEVEMKQPSQGVVATNGAPWSSKAVSGA